MAEDHRRVSFEGFVFDPASGELRHTVSGGGGTATRLPPKPARMLALLLERPGELVPRDELVAALWPGQHLDIDASETGDTGDPDPASETAAPPPPTRPARAIRSGAVLPLLLLLALALSLVSLRFAGTDGPSRAAATAATRVALLPLRPPDRLAGDPQALAANQRLGQRLLVALADQQGLAVVGPATTAAAVTEGQTPEETGAVLDVAYTISGGHAPDEEILFLQVIRTADGGHIHARRHAGDEAALGRRLPAIAEEVARVLR